MGKTPRDLRNKWRELGGETYLERKKDEWSVEETIDLLLLVESCSGKKYLKNNIQECIERLVRPEEGFLVRRNGQFYFNGDDRLQKLKYFLDSIHEDVAIPLKITNWHTVSSKLGKHSPNDCRNKWEKQLYLMLTSKKQFTPMNDIELAKAVQRQGIEHYLDIDFSELNAIQGAEEARNRWIQLTKMTGLSVVAVSYTHLTLPTTPYV
eukprot:TRINITY_DN8664_c0_g1_i9.p1 TRINITY_DN8664_c0_g1~~TRINITY_DN8664_c0_g1_i9.p1  ORF type:complete len:208 (+),score=48.64 TRINITY_DN8664_c0_g1_i9:888-1511(+)